VEDRVDFESEAVSFLHVVRARVGLERERFVNLDDLKRVLDSNDDVFHLLEYIRKLPGVYYFGRLYATSSRHDYNSAVEKYLQHKPSYELHVETDDYDWVLVSKYRTIKEFLVALADHDDIRRLVESA